jgi:glucose-1-phosphate adenylyltransferase
VQVHLFDGYWEDVGTIRSYFDSSLSLASPSPPFELALPDAPIYSRPEFLPPSLLEGAVVRGSLIADGCRIAPDAVIENSIIGARCVIGRGVTIRNSIIMGADEYETAGQKAETARLGLPPIGIGDGAVIEHAIVDKNCRVGQRARIVNDGGGDTSPDAVDCVVRDGIPIVVKEATLPEGWRLSR